MNERYRAWGALKSVLNNWRLGITAKKCLYEVVIVPSVLYGAEAWGMRSAERRKLNVLQMKCLRSLVGVSQMDRVGNHEVRRRAGIKRELASRADQRVLRWFGHMKRMDEYRMARKVLIADVSGGRVRGRPRLGWIDVAENTKEWRALVHMKMIQFFCMALCSFGPPSKALVYYHWRVVRCRYMMLLG